jgi:hypothetical protein
MNKSGNKIIDRQVWRKAVNDAGRQFSDAPGENKNKDYDKNRNQKIWKNQDKSIKPVL